MGSGFIVNQPAKRSVRLGTLGPWHLLNRRFSALGFVSAFKLPTNTVRSSLSSSLSSGTRSCAYRSRVFV